MINASAEAKPRKSAFNRTSKPFALSVRVKISRVQRPIFSPFHFVTGGAAISCVAVWRLGPAPVKREVALRVVTPLLEAPVAARQDDRVRMLLRQREGVRAPTQSDL
ncbi:hypothetical protein V8P78_14335 [Rhizobium sp. 6AS6]|uniref:Uncharacterized protein n=1 Tax=Rhizobium aouanii TaxID=3118145 RepID=A0ABU8CIN0_9HYPH|nr:hypothetical protein [Rhizobium acaciae]MCW1750292.1 hypothetical protein [Rhizobium acaciae]